MMSCCSLRLRRRFRGLLSLAHVLVVTTLGIGLAGCLSAPVTTPASSSIDPSQSYEETEALSLLAATTHTALTRQNVGAVAVYDFATSRGHYTRLGRQFADLFLTSVMNGSPRYEIYDRVSIQLAEQEARYNFNQLFTDSANFRQIGEFLGADAVAFGELSQQSTSWNVHIRVVRATTGSVLYAGSVRVRATSDHLRMFTRLPPGE